MKNNSSSKVIWVLKKLSIAIKKPIRYIVYTISATLFGTKRRKKEEQLMQHIERLRQINIPPHIREKLNLKDNWQQDVSQDFVKKVVDTAEKHKKTLKELSKY